MGEILKAPEHMLHPRDYVAPSTDNAQSQGATNVIQRLAEGQVFNNMSQGTGIAGPALWGKTDESNGSRAETGGTKVSCSYSVDLVSGQNSHWAGGRTSSGQ